MKKILLTIAVCSFAVGGLLVSTPAQANTYSEDWIPQLYVTVDGEEVDTDFVLRIKALAHDLKKGEEERYVYDTFNCDEGECQYFKYRDGRKPEYTLAQFPESIPESTANDFAKLHDYYKENKESVIATYPLEGMDLEPRHLQKVDYNITVDTAAGTVEIEEHDKGEWDPLEDFKHEIPAEVKRMFALYIGGLIVGVVILCVIVIAIYRFARKKVSKTVPKDNSK